MSTTAGAGSRTTSRDQAPGAWIRHHFGRGRALIMLAALVLVLALALNWNWLLAVGIVPLLISVLPCVAMCAFGLCMARTGGRSCAAEKTPSSGNALRKTNALSVTNDGDQRR